MSSTTDLMTISCEQGSGRTKGISLLRDEGRSALDEPDVLVLTRILVAVMLETYLFESTEYLLDRIFIKNMFNYLRDQR